MGALADREVCGLRARRLVRHFQACSRCHRRYQTLLQWKRRAREMARLTAPPALHARVRDRLRAEPPPARPATAPRPRPWMRRPAISWQAAALTVLLAVAGLAAGRALHQSRRPAAAHSEASGILPALAANRVDPQMGHARLASHVRVLRVLRQLPGHVAPGPSGECSVLGADVRASPRRQSGVPRQPARGGAHSVRVCPAGSPMPTAVGLGAMGLLLLLKCGPHPAAGDPARDALVRAARQILRHQGPDGALAMAEWPAPRNRLVPYFANFAAMGLAVASSRGRVADALPAARRWVEWYEAHQNADGTIYDYLGASGAWESTGDYDSSDSYAATYLELLLEMHRARPDPAWLKARGPAVRRAVAAIRLTLQANGLTLAKPTWPVMYAMDNVETSLGLRAAARIAALQGDRELSAQADALASAMQGAIQRELWDPALECYRVGIQTDGGRMEGLEKWYPDIMANLMAVGWLPYSERNRALFARMKARFGEGLPDAVRSADDLERLAWWGYAARGARDRALSRRIEACFHAFDAHVRSLNNPALLGHVCRLLGGR